MYGFWHLFSGKEPSDELIASVAALEGDKTPIGNACSTLARLAKSMDNELIRNEYVSVFIGVGRGEILPFASYYLTGFLNDKPLANLRNEMSRIGLRALKPLKSRKTTFQVCSILWPGSFVESFGRSFSVAEQAEFYRKHIEPWIGMLMADIEAAKLLCFACAGGHNWKIIY